MAATEDGAEKWSCLPPVQRDEEWALSQELTARPPFVKRSFRQPAQGPLAATAEKLSALSTLCVPENACISLILFKKYSKLSRKVLYHPTGLQSQ